MKYFLLILSLSFSTLSLMAMEREHSTPRKSVSWDKDLDSTYIPQYVPTEVELEDDFLYLYAAYKQMQDKIIDQGNQIKSLRHALNHEERRVDSIFDTLASLNKKINKKPWYKRLNCFKRNR